MKTANMEETAVIVCLKKRNKNKRTSKKITVQPKN